jgi:hypothetical protein
MVNPFFSVVVSPGRASVRGRRGGRHLMGSDEDRPANLRIAQLLSHRWVGNGLA